MAKTEYTKDSIVSFVKNLDTRAKTLTDEKIDNIINRAYAELGTVSKKLFSAEEVISLDEYYEVSELKATLDVEDDATEIYDLYLTLDDDGTKNLSICQDIVQGVGIYRNDDMLYRDRYVGRFHLDLTDMTNTIFDDMVVKYYYTPKATDLSVFMESQLYLAFQDAIWAALNYFLKDIEGEAQKRASMARTTRSAPQEPEDEPEEIRAMFGGI